MWWSNTRTSAAAAIAKRLSTVCLRFGAAPHAPLVVLSAVVAAAVALRAGGVAVRSLWFDEAFSWRMASFSWGELLERSKLDNHPPLYWALLKAWIACFGDSAAAMRSLSVACGAASCVGVYLMVVEAYRPNIAIESRRTEWMGLFAAALVAVAALQVRWGWEVRMYALGAALAAFSSWLLLRALRARVETEHEPGSSHGVSGEPVSGQQSDPCHGVSALQVAGQQVSGQQVSRLRDVVAWLLYAAVALAFAYTHTYALFSLAAQALFAAGYLLAEVRRRPRAFEPIPKPPGRRDAFTTRRFRDRPFFGSTRFRWALVGFGLVIAGWLPWLPVLLRQRVQVEEAYWLGPMTRWTVPNICHEMFIDPEGRTTNQRDAAIAATACAAVLLSLLWRPCFGDWFLLLSAIVPIVLATTISALGTNILQVRYFVFAQIFLLAALARLLGRISHWPERTVVGMVVLGGLLLAHLDFVDGLDIPHRSGLREAGEHIAARRRHGEPVIVSNPYFYLPIRYYVRGQAECRLLHAGRPLLHYEGAAALVDGDAIDPSELAALAAERVWVVGGLGALPDGWRRVSQAAFYEGYGVQGAVVVIEYATRSEE